jgi:hypothetical protein
MAEHTPGQPRNPRTPRRSRSVTILAVLHFLQSLVLLGFGIYLVSTTGWSQPEATQASRFLPLALFQGMISGVVTLVFALLGAVIAFALLRLKSWAWMAAMELQGLGLIAALYAYLRGNPNYVGMLISIILVFYLNQQEIRAAFRGRHVAGLFVQDQRGER